MFFIRDAYATFWEANPNEAGTIYKGRISTSDKQTKDGEVTYQNSNWFATFVGKAKDKVDDLSAKDKIKIITGKVSNPSFKTDDGYKNYLNVTIFDFEVMSNDGIKEEEFEL